MEQIITKFRNTNVADGRLQTCANEAKIVP
jgi:hypothetical protein